jgi:hypothetical protein
MNSRRHEEEGRPEEEDDDEDWMSHAAGDWVPDFHWVDDRLAIGGCFPIEQAARLSGEFGIGAVVDLREEDCDDAARLRDAGIALLHLPTPDLEPASVEMLDRGVRFVRERMKAGERVLVHCQHGIGRSALLGLCVLVDGGREPLDALAQAKDARAVLSPSRAQYEGWADWLASRGKPVPDYHSFGCIAYRHLASG